MRRGLRAVLGSLLVVVGVGVAGQVFGHGDVQPQPVDTTGLQPLGDEWRKTNPYRNNELALKIGASAFNQNCARCHGLEAISGGIAPDLRYLDKADEGDEWFLTRIRNGYTQNGLTKMPKFEGILSQEAMWAIRTYLDSRYDG
ncbi:MAG: cytochrome c-550 PedF [Alsobacter sp.]